MISSINVIQLIAHAGGPTEFAKKKAVYVLHPDIGRGPGSTIRKYYRANIRKRISNLFLETRWWFHDQPA